MDAARARSRCCASRCSCVITSGARAMISWADAHAGPPPWQPSCMADLEIDLTAADRRVRGDQDAWASCSPSRRSGACRGLYLPETADAAASCCTPGHPRTRQRYTAGHELGHHVFDHAAEIDVDLEDALRRGDVERWPDHEKEAEAFGAWFLMPRRLICARTAGTRHRPRREIRSMSTRCRCGSALATPRRRASSRVVRLVELAEADRWAKVQPRAIKQALAGDMVPDDMRNDVWWLDARHNRHPIDARPGDRLVLTLDEIPATGYSWRFSELAGGCACSPTPTRTTGSPSSRTPPAPRKSSWEADMPRSMMLEIDPLAPGSVQRLALIKDQEWRPGVPIRRVRAAGFDQPPAHRHPGARG